MDFTDKNAFNDLWSTLDDENTPAKHSSPIVPKLPDVYLTQVKSLIQHAVENEMPVGQFQCKLAFDLYQRNADPALISTLDPDCQIGVLIKAEGHVQGFGLVSEGWERIAFD